MAKVYRLYVGSLMAFYCALTLWLVWTVDNKEMWLVNWSSDKSFLFFLLIPLLIGYSLIDNEMSIPLPIRYKTRRNYHFHQLQAYSLLTISVVCIYWSFFMIGALFIHYQLTLSNASQIIQTVVRFILGSLMASNGCLLFQRTNTVNLSKRGGVSIFFVAYLELMFLVTFVKAIGLPNKFIFSWIFEKSIMGPIILIFLNLFSVFLMGRLNGRKDFL